MGASAHEYHGRLVRVGRAKMALRLMGKMPMLLKGAGL